MLSPSSDLMKIQRTGSPPLSVLAESSPLWLPEFFENILKITRKQFRLRRFLSAPYRARVRLNPLCPTSFLGDFRLLSFEGGMDEADSATKALGLDEPPIGEPPVEGVGSDTESEAEVTTMAVMAEPGNIGLGAESLPNPDEAEAAFAGNTGYS